jgi:chitinase
MKAARLLEVAAISLQVVLGQTNIPEIYNWTLSLWYDSVYPTKIVIGLAYYGRGYTLAEPGCNSIGCAWSTVSRPGPCTSLGAVMSLQKIENLIPQLRVQPSLLANDMMKQLTWGDQWIGYDDMQTIAVKKQRANSHCFGGTMIWSIDLYPGVGSGNTQDGGGFTNLGDPGAGSGQVGASGGDSSGIVYI